MFSSKSELNLLNRVKNGFNLHANSDGIELTMHKELNPPYLIHYTCLHRHQSFSIEVNNSYVMNFVGLILTKILKP